MDNIRNLFQDFVPKCLINLIIMMNRPQIFKQIMEKDLRSLVNRFIYKAKLDCVS